MSASARGMLLSVLTCMTASLSPSPVAARETSYCKQVRARAQSDADLLMMPRLLLQGIRFPRGAQQLDSGATTTEGYQLRTGFAFSPVDFYKGRATLRVGAADCQRHDTSLDLDAVLARGADDARLRALREQAEFLRGRGEDWRALQARAAARLSQRIITLVEFTNVQRFVDELERKLVQVEGDANQLGARAQRPPTSELGPSTPGGLPSAPLPVLATRHLDAALRFEREVSALRRLDDWRLQLSGGVIPQTPSDWYGTVELSFNLGGLLRGAHEETYLEARSESLEHATDGVETRLQQFRAEVGALLDRAQRELSVVQHSLDVIVATRRALEASDAESVAQARDILTIEQLSVESDSVFLRELVNALTTLAERARG